MEMKNKYFEAIEALSDRDLILNLIITQVLLLVVSLGMGWYLFNDSSEFLALFKWDDWRILTIGVVAGIAVVIIDLCCMKFLPESLYDDGGLNNKLFRNRTVPQIALIAASVAISEEILFRGVIQTHFGLIISSVVFAIIHLRYLFNWFMFLNIVLLSFFVGYIYAVTGNLIVTITMHFCIDFLLGWFIMRSEKGKTSGGDII